jgi:DNA-binding NarL/FixJ family response regulator
MSEECLNGGRSTPRILIVEDDAAMARSLAGIAKSFGVVTVEPTLRGALAQAAGRVLWSAFIVDLCLPDGSGLDFLRTRAWDIPTLVLSGYGDHDAINSVFELRAQYLSKPATRVQIAQFLGSVAERPSARAPSASELMLSYERVIAERVEKVAKSFGLTQLDVDLIHACLHGLSGKEYIEARALSVNAYKRRVRRVLRKLGAYSMGEVRDRLLKSLQTLP